MTLSDLIQLGLLLVTVAALLWSQYSDRQQRKLSMFAEYTKRYLDVILSMPDSVLMGSADVKTDVLKHLQLYFDLCSERILLVATRHCALSYLGALERRDANHYAKPCFSKIVG